MLDFCKRRKIEYTTNHKRKLTNHTYIENTSKRQRFYSPINYNKRKIETILLCSQKRQKLYHDFYHCICHKDIYICDIYECSGIKEKYINDKHMPYII